MFEFFKAEPENKVHAAFSLEISEGIYHNSYFLQISGQRGFAGKQRTGPQEEAQKLGAFPFLAGEVPEEMCLYVTPDQCANCHQAEPVKSQALQLSAEISF